MALTEETAIDQIAIDEYGHVSVRSATTVRRDGVTISTSYHRRMVAFGEPFPDDLEGTNAGAIIDAVAALTWKPVPELEA